MSSGQIAHWVHNEAFEFIENFMHATNCFQEKNTRKLGEKKILVHQQSVVINVVPRMYGIHTGLFW